MMASPWLPAAGAAARCGCDVGKIFGESPAVVVERSAGATLPELRSFVESAQPIAQGRSKLTRSLVWR